MHRSLCGRAVAMLFFIILVPACGILEEDNSGAGNHSLSAAGNSSLPPAGAPRPDPGGNLSLARINPDENQEDKPIAVAFSEIAAHPFEGAVVLTWTNPEQQQLAWFSLVSYGYRGGDIISREYALLSAEEYLAAGAQVNYSISGLDPALRYEFWVAPGFSNPRYYTNRFCVSSSQGCLIRLGPNNDGDTLLDFEDQDNDNDGINDFVYNTTDALDNCPLAANPQQTDSDNDTLGDACDADDDNDGIADFAADGITPLDNCRLIANPEQLDIDNDGTGNLCDSDFGFRAESARSSLRVDANGNGLIDIATAEQLSNIRYALDGAYYTNGSYSANSSTGLRYGCGLDGQQECRGYELTADIDLAGYNWQPLGSCPDSGGCNASNSFSTLLEGNDYSINNLTIHSSTNRSNLGLFAATAAASRIQNLNLINARITAAPGLITRHVGILAGRGSGRISSVAVSGELEAHSYLGGIAGTAKNLDILEGDADISSMNVTVCCVGGLIGDAYDSDIRSSVATVDYLRATGPGGHSAGGLVGRGTDGSIASSRTIITGILAVGGVAGGIGGHLQIYEIADSRAVAYYIIGGRKLGGLVGHLGIAPSNYKDYHGIVRGSDAFSLQIDASEDYAGGLVAYGQNVLVRNSYSIGGEISARSYAGGLIGGADNSRLVANFASARDVISDSSHAAGMIAELDTSSIYSSYAVAKSIIAANDKAGGLAASVEESQVFNSYVLTGYISSPGGATGGLAPQDLASSPLGNPTARAVKSYWDRSIISVGFTTNFFPHADIGARKNTSELQHPSFSGIYAGWASYDCSGGGIVWDLGSASQYPVLNCVALSRTAQRNLIASILAD